MSNRPLSERNIKVIDSTRPKEVEQRAKRKLRVAAYCRVSTESKEQETSFDSQVSYYTKLICDNPEWEYVDTYADPAISGTSRKHRKGFNRMLYDCLKGKIDMVITKSMSRFARNQLDSLAVIRMLNGLHPPVRIMFEDDRIFSDDLSSEIIITITSMLAEQESVKKSTSVKWGFERRKEQGHYLVPTKTLLGYDKTEAKNKDDREIFIVEDEAMVVRVIFWMLLIGCKISEIAYELTKAGVKTGKGNVIWNEGSVLGILKNERYAGDVRTNKTKRDSLWTKRTKNNGEVSYIYETDHHPAIVSHEVFNMAQKLIASHRYGYDPFINCTYSLSIIDEGLFKGFIPINIHWAGSDLEEYIALGNTVEQTRDLLEKGLQIPYFPGCQMVRREDLGHQGRPGLKITPSSISPNQASIEIFDTEFIDILFNPIEKLIAIRRSEQGLPGALRWRKQVENKILPASFGCSAFCKILYDLMKWPKLWNTTILAMTYQKDGEFVMVFDLAQTEINALPYEKPKKKKKNDADDAYYNIEAMIAQQLELLHNKQDAEVVLTEKDEEQELPPPKRKKYHPYEWANTFGLNSADAAIGCRRYQFETLHEWNVSADGVRIAEFDHSVLVSDQELKSAIQQIKTGSKSEIKEED